MIITNTPVIIVAIVVSCLLVACSTAVDSKAIQSRPTSQGAGSVTIPVSTRIEAINIESSRLGGELELSGVVETMLYIRDVEASIHMREDMRLLSGSPNWTGDLSLAINTFSYKVSIPEPGDWEVKFRTSSDHPKNVFNLRGAASICISVSDQSVTTKSGECAGFSPLPTHPLKARPSNPDLAFHLSAKLVSSTVVDVIAILCASENLEPTPLTVTGEFRFPRGIILGTGYGSYTKTMANGSTAQQTVRVRVTEDGNWPIGGKIYPYNPDPGSFINADFVYVKVVDGNITLVRETSADCR